MFELAFISCFSKSVWLIKVHAYIFETIYYFTNLLFQERMETSLTVPNTSCSHIDCRRMHPNKNQ